MVIKEMPVSADTTIKIEMSGRYYKKTVTTVDKNGKPHEEVTEGYDGDEDLRPLIARRWILFASLAIPAIPVIPPTNFDIDGHEDTMFGMQAIASATCPI